MHVKRVLSTSASNDRSSALNVIAWNGSVVAVMGLPVSEASDAATAAWSKAGRFCAVAASATTNAKPPFTDFRYQSRLVEPIQLGASARSTTRLSSRWRTDSARA